MTSVFVPHILVYPGQSTVPTARPAVEAGVEEKPTVREAGRTRKLKLEPQTLKDARGRADVQNTNKSQWVNEASRACP